jgi:hypothetical protein
MTLKKIVGTGAIAGALGLSAIGLAGAASAAPTPQVAPGTVQHVQLDDWHGGGRGGGWHGDGRDWRGGDRGGDRGWRGPGWGGPGFWGGPPCPFGACY